MYNISHEPYMPTVADAGARPNFIKRIGNGLRNLYHIARSSYFIEIAILAPPTEEQKKDFGPQFKGTARTKAWLKYNEKTGYQDFVNELNQATCFDAVLALSTTRALQKLFHDMPNTQVTMVEASDALFVDCVTGGPAAEAEREPGFANFTDHAHRAQAQVRITDKGKIWLKDNMPSYEGQYPTDILFLIALSDRMWHSLVELEKRQWPDFAGIIAQAKEKELIELV